MEELDPWYITGFCDGEAAFTFSRGGGSFNMYFGITQREDNRQVLDDIHAHFEYVGKIYYRKESSPSRYSGFTKPSAYYRITRPEELTVIIDHFDKYPLRSKKKYEAYKIWREMVMHKLHNYRSADYDKMRVLAEQLSKTNSKSRSFKVHTH